jgi:pimeloyl-ACP methyl ester carboxylesterase
VWWQIGRALVAAGYPSAAPDLRGHGESPRSDRYTLDGYARDVVSSHSGPWDLVIGHSLGGATAVRAATLDPGFASRYLLIDPAIDLDAATVATLRSELVAEAEHPPSVAQLIADHPAWHREDAERKHAAIRATTPFVMAATFDDNPEWQLGAELSDISTRVHILGADLDPLYTSNDFERHVRPGSILTFEIVSDTGHSIHRDDPKTVIRHAQAMLRKPWPPSAAH